MNSKEENSEDFCPNYVQEFGLWLCSQLNGCRTLLTSLGFLDTQVGTIFRQGDFLACLPEPATDLDFFYLSQLRFIKVLVLMSKNNAQKDTTIKVIK